MKSQVKSDLVNHVELLREWTTNGESVVPLLSICETIEAYDTLQSQLTQAQSGWRTMQEKCERLEIQFAEITIQLTQAHKERDEKKSELAELWSKTETIINDRTKALIQEKDEAVAVAACAAMRGALEKCTNMYAPSMLIARTALASTTAGADFLARLKEAEWLINNSFRVGSINRAMAKEWLTRRDAWLKGGDE